MSGPTVHWYVRITLIGATILLSVNMVMITVVLDDDCISFGQAISWSSALAFISTSLLLQLRVWAVFHSSVIIQAIFALLWVVVIIGSFSIGFSNRVWITIHWMHCRSKQAVCYPRISACNGLRYLDIVCSLN